MANSKINPLASVKATIYDGKLQTSRVEIEGYLTIDYDKYVRGFSLLECLILSETDSTIANFPEPQI
jgi:hypothetical protein